MSTSTVDRELENKHRALWALGDYPAIADALVVAWVLASGMKDQFQQVMLMSTHVLHLIDKDMSESQAKHRGDGGIGRKVTMR